MRRFTFSAACHSSNWVDKQFESETPETLEEGEIDGYSGFEYVHRQDAAGLLLPQVRIRTRLPNLSRRFDLSLERDDERKTIEGQSENAIQQQLGAANQNTTRLGFGYELFRRANDLLNLRAGIRISERKLDPFVRGRYTWDIERTEQTEWRFAETLFYRHLEGFGETTSLDHQRNLTKTLLFRWSNSATLSQSTDGFRWDSNISLLHTFDEHHGMLYSYGASGQTGQAEPLANFGPRVSYRQKLNRKWLFGEVYVGLDRIKDEIHPVRTSVGYIGAKLEAHFLGE